jgi:hypothetical protein
VSVPDADVTLDPTATTATTTFDTSTNTWETTVPTRFSGNVFLVGLALPLPSGLPGGTNPVTWQANFTATVGGVSVNWQWGAAVYTSFSTDYTALGIKAVDDNHFGPYLSSDHAGTPEAFKSFVTGGARGGGGSNWTGSLSPTKTVVPDVQTQQQTATLSGRVTDVNNNGIQGVLLTLMGFDTMGNKVSMQMSSDVNGNYMFTGLPAGSYSVTATSGTSGVDASTLFGTFGQDNGLSDGSPSGNVINSINLNAGDNGVFFNFHQVNN